MKVNQTYVVANFVYHILPNGEMVVQNQHGVVKVNNHTMIAFIEKLDNQTYTYINEKDIYQYFEGQSEKATAFLLEYKIIDYKGKLNFNVQKVKLMTNHGLLKEKAYHLFANSDPNMNIKIYSANDLHVNDHDFVMVFLNPYDKNLAKKILNEVNLKDDAILMMSYMYNNKFYIDSLYSKKWRNPCHFCHMGHIESQLRISDTDSLSYQQLIDILYHEDNSFQVETPLENLDILNILTVLFNHLDRFIVRKNSNILLNHESLQDINDCITLDLTTKIKSKDTGIYWELCDCYE